MGRLSTCLISKISGTTSKTRRMGNAKGPQVHAGAPINIVPSSYHTKIRHQFTFTEKKATCNSKVAPRVLENMWTP